MTFANDIVGQVSAATVFNDSSELLQDKDYDHLLDLVIKLVAKPDVPMAKVVPLVIQLQAMSAKFALLAKQYMVFGVGDKEASKRKNFYLTAAEQADKLASALKYYAR